MNQTVLQAHFHPSWHIRLRSDTTTFVGVTRSNRNNENRWVGRDRINIWRMWASWACIVCLQVTHEWQVFMWDHFSLVVRILTSHCPIDLQLWIEMSRLSTFVIWIQGTTSEVFWHHKRLVFSYLRVIPNTG